MPHTRPPCTRVVGGPRHERAGWDGVRRTPSIRGGRRILSVLGDATGSQAGTCSPHPCSDRLRGDHGRTRCHPGQPKEAIRLSAAIRQALGDVASSSWRGSQDATATRQRQPAVASLVSCRPCDAKRPLARVKERVSSSQKGARPMLERAHPKRPAESTARRWREDR
jgi:hypothetical protein